VQREAVEMICPKHGRIIAGDPSCAEHRRDLAGYAWLAGRDLDQRDGQSPSRRPQLHPASNEDRLNCQYSSNRSIYGRGWWEGESRWRTSYKSRPAGVITGAFWGFKKMKTGIIAALLAIGLAFAMNSSALAQAVPDEAPAVVLEDTPVAPVDPKSGTVKISLLIKGKDVCDLTLLQSKTLLGGVASCTKSTVPGFVVGSGKTLQATLGTSNSAFALEIILVLAKKNLAPYFRP
jgi:hypothetical protein